jgi:hypothetical protein
MTNDRGKSGVTSTESKTTGTEENKGIDADVQR